MNTNASLDKIKAVFAKYSPDQPFDYHFVDEDYAKKFGNEQRTGKLAGVFAALAIFISCLGLFGMASFMAGATGQRDRRPQGIGRGRIWSLQVVEQGLCRTCMYRIADRTACFLVWDASLAGII